MKYDLATLTRRANPGFRRRAIILRDIVPPATLATDLYRAAYLPVVQVWSRHAETIIAEYERTLSALRTDAPADLQARLDAAQTELERLYILLDAGLKDFMLRTERWQRGKFRGAVLSATGVDLQTMLGPEDQRATIETYLQWNSSLIRDVSDEIRKKVSNSVFAGLQNRTPARDVAKQIREATAFGRARSQRVAVDQLSKITSSLADERRREAGLDVWKWRHSGKRHPREVHRARDGNYYTDNPALVGKVVDSVTILAAPERNDQPGMPPYCGCRRQAVLLFD